MPSPLKFFTSVMQRKKDAAALEDDVLNDLLPAEPWTIETAREYVADLCAKARAGDPEAEFALADHYMDHSVGMVLRPDPLRKPNG
jgi:hypothetical protein